MIKINQRIGIKGRGTTWRNSTNKILEKKSIGDIEVKTPS